ncbi:MAG: tRNA (adenosine(37)-N6)-threonylcarbamoyltransferase complex dimerization subunit type 1 TsaB [Mariprofundus sp.]|nr:tRNA (adenosine(37)-N6)-threonylcarbamoyltransferase complex dimerization subunit type 1 TsaB [Mariprofundus sp.]
MISSPSVLALDMACGEIAVCVQRGESSFFSSISASSQQGKMRSTVIVPLMHDVLMQADLSWQDLDALALGAGPGSFTGLRIAAATLAGINSGLQLPIMHLSSLAITARQSEITSNDLLWVLQDARAGEVFVGQYQQNQNKQADICLSWSDVEAIPAGNFCCHGEPPLDMDGWTRVPLSLQRSAALALEVGSFCESADALSKLSALPVYPAALYLQLSQAERHAYG